MRDMYYDVVIAGCGVAGLYTALRLGRDKKILMLSKEDLESCDSMLAQGGICASLCGTRLICLAASKPSIFGITISIRIASK